MTVQFALKVDGTKLDFALRELGAGLHKWSAAWPNVADVIRNLLVEQFASEGSRGPAGPWAPLSEAYARRKRKKHPGKPILQATGALVDSLTGSTANTVEGFEDERMRFGTAAPYAIYHQTGAPGSGLPRRPIIDWAQGEDDFGVTQALHRRLAEVAGSVGFGITASGAASSQFVGHDVIGIGSQRGGPGEATMPISASL